MFPFFFLFSFFSYELAEECADDEEDKLAIRKLRKRVKQKLKTLDSLVRVCFLFFSSFVYSLFIVLFFFVFGITC